MLGIVAAYGRPMPKNRDRAADSRRLKAARWLAGTGRNDRGQLIALPVAELAGMEPLKRNRISASRLEEIEQERTDARDMELEKVAEALELPASFLLRGTATASDAVLDELRELREQVGALVEQSATPAQTVAELVTAMEQLVRAEVQRVAETEQSENASDQETDSPATGEADAP